MQVDFYILGDNSPRNINQMVCRLCEKATAHNMNVLIYAQSMQQAQELDNLLWTFKPDSFIAHTYLHQGQHSFEQSEPEQPASSQQEKAFDFPVLIISADSSPATVIPEQYNQLLINLTTESPPFHTRFKRLAELVGNNDNEKQIARNRYKLYRQNDYTLNKFDL